MPVREVFDPRYPALRYIAQEDQGDYLAAIRSSVVDAGHLVVTFDGLLQRTPFAGYMRTMLALLEKNYRSPVDTEFTVEVVDPQALHPQVKITILQCRPQSAINDEGASIPDDLAGGRCDPFHPPHGAAWCSAWHLLTCCSSHRKDTLSSELHQTARIKNAAKWAIGALNASLERRDIHLRRSRTLGDLRLPHLGVHVAYGDIYNTRALVELSGGEVLATDPEPSFGTHFFQDLMDRFKEAPKNLMPQLGLAHGNNLVWRLLLPKAGDNQR